MSERTRTVLVVDTDPASRERLGDMLTPGFRSVRVGSGEAALQVLDREEVDLMLLDLHLPGIGGLDVLRIVRENAPWTEVVALSQARDLDLGIEAIRVGAYHYIDKGIDAASLRAILDHAVERQELNRQVTRLHAEVAEHHERPFVVGPSRPTRELVELARRIAPLPATVLILGESGTGKELLARLIHRTGGDPERPFVAVNLAAIPSELVESTLFGHERGAFTGAIRQQIGKFELANGGTLFLDEIGDLRTELQAKLLRALQEEEIERVGGTHTIPTSFRLIAATNLDLEKAVKEGRFRGDLYYRLNVIPMHMPPLRNRLEDLPELANFFLRRYNQKFHKRVRGIADSTLRLLASYWWPGNIRELENLVERLVAVSEKEWITDEDLPYEFHVAQVQSTAPATTNVLDAAMMTFERNFLLRALDRNGWNVTATARALGLPLSTLKFKMDRLEIRELARRIRGH